MRQDVTIVIAATLALAVAPATQTFPINPDADRTEGRSPDDRMREVGRTADTGIGEIGQRQTREEAAPNIEPIGRIDNRVENRVQNRLRNRVDRDYDPAANSAAPFERAARSARDAGNRRPRR